MKKVTLYSKSSRSRAFASVSARQSEDASVLQDQGTPVQSHRRLLHMTRLRAFLARHERLMLVASAGLLSLLLFIAYSAGKPPIRQITQKDIDAAVMHTLENNVLPSPETKAYQIIRHSVVRVRQLEHRQDKNSDRIKGIGTGVVIVDKGVILTNLHVVAGAERVQVEFSDGLVSEASVVSLQPENDLAVLQAKTIPDDLVPATLRST
ncbi:MAG: peptidase and chymotrypsin/Hap, partial [Herminiimonas sp.]|nr:peptidase and chymotrypsin/Hap [Herminiimonas sp.]